jgi:hypothetical protein
MLANEEVFGIIDVLVRARLDAVDNLPASSVGKVVVMLQRGVLLAQDQSGSPLECISYRRSVGCLVSRDSWQF